MSIFVGIMSFVNVLFLCLGIYSTILVGRRRSMPADKLFKNKYQSVRLYT